MSWKFTEEEFKLACAKSFGVKETLQNLGIERVYGNTYNVFWKRVAMWNVDVSHFTGNASHKANLKKDVLLSITEGALFKNADLKKRLFESGILENKCAECSLEKEWQGKPIVLHLDHINGIKTDNRVENLRILCPNCHSQTETFCGRNRTSVLSECARCLQPKRYAGEKHCQDCKKERRKESIQRNIQKGLVLIKGRPNNTPTKGNYPANEELEKIVWQIPMTTLAKQIGVSDRALKFYCKRRGIKTPSPGHWAKEYAKKN